MKKFNLQTRNCVLLQKLKLGIIQLLVLCTIVIFQSCSTAKWIAPPYTNVSKITHLKSGMSVQEINNSLGIEPYDVYHIQQDGSTVLVYNYRLKDRRMDVPADPTQRERTIRNSEGAQTEGETWYGEASQLFILMKDNKMKSLLTDNGSANSSFILLQNNAIQLISKKELATLNGGGAAGGDAVVLPLKKETKTPMQKSQTQGKKGGKWLGILGVIGLTSLLILLIGSAAE